MTEDNSIPDAGRVLVTGPSNSGKTYLTARTLERWVDAYGSGAVVVLDFAPEVEHNGQVLGGRLERETELPPDAWAGVLEAHAPRSDSESPTAARALARENAQRATKLLEAMPTDPNAVFVNDATIAFQHERSSLETLLSRTADADLVVINAFESDELGTNDPISQRERDVLELLSGWAETHVRLFEDGGCK